MAKDQTIATHSGSAGPTRRAKLLGDIGIYAIGNLGAKLVTFLMVPLYTHYIDSTDDFGYYELCLTACFLLMPFVTMQLRDCAFRFLMDSADERWRQRVVTLTYRVLAQGIAVAVALALTASMWLNVRYLWLSVGLLVAMSLQEVVQQVFRGLGHNRAFVTVGILSAFGIGALSVVLVVWQKMGVEGIFWANIGARLLALLAVELRVGTLRRYFRVRLSHDGLAADMLRYSLPLLPGTICWWAMGSSDRWFISQMVSLDSGGIYAVAARMVGVVQTAAFIFYQAWQETALRQYHSPDRNTFFSRVLAGYIVALTALVSVFALTMKWLYPILVAPVYAASLQYVLPLAVSAGMFAVVAFFDLGYQCAKDTKRTLPAVFAAAATNVVLNLLLVPRYQAWGAVVAALTTNAVLIAWRWHDMRRYMTLCLPVRLLWLCVTTALTTVAFYCRLPWWAQVLAALAGLAALFPAIGLDNVCRLMKTVRARCR